jgi:hypothetical protein
MKTTECNEVGNLGASTVFSEPLIVKVFLFWGSGVILMEFVIYLAWCAAEWRF